MHDFLATCPQGFESTLCRQLHLLGAAEVEEKAGGAAFKAEFATAQTICLHAALASRIMLRLVSFKCEDDSDLYMGSYGVNWERYFDVDKTIAVSFLGTSDALRNTQYSALKIKDGLCDRFFSREGRRPDVSRDNPMVHVAGRLHRGEAALYLDLCGDSLQQRHIQKKIGEAPLNENLAAYLLLRAGYEGGNFIDPMCGSGTLLIEAASMATRRAASLSRKHFAFENLSLYDKDSFAKARQDALECFERGKQKFLHSGFKIIGFDKDPKMVKTALENLESAGLSSEVQVYEGAIEDFVNPLCGEPLTVITNPPYGERLGSAPDLLSLYETLGRKLKEQCPKTTAGVISSDPALLCALRLCAFKTYKVHNGPLKCEFRLYKIERRGTLKEEDEALDFQNRLKKNLKNLKTMAQREGLEAYRLYDGDLPEYRAAIDRYGDYYVLQEYRAPSSVDPKIARRRLMLMIEGAMKVLGCNSSHLIVKTRQIQQGTGQYQKNSGGGIIVAVAEGKARFEVNLDEYLDTGLFLDSRPVRKRLAMLSGGKSLLNLFCYTGSATVQAALGGATHSLSVDMSRTYLQWCLKNFKLNGLDLKRHEILQADCLSYISRTDAKKWDVIYIDPPSFSNSKRMEHSLDVMRDQTALLSNLTGHLNDGGVILFCTNLRSFKLDEEGLKPYGLAAEDISAPTIPQDFKRNQKIHRCYLLHFDKSAQTKEPEPMVSRVKEAKWEGKIAGSSDGRIKDDGKSICGLGGGKAGPEDKRPPQKDKMKRRTIRVFGPQGEMR